MLTVLPCGICCSPCKCSWRLKHMPAGSPAATVSHYSGAVHLHGIMHTANTSLSLTCSSKALHALDTDPAANLGTGEPWQQHYVITMSAMLPVMSEFPTALSPAASVPRADFSFLFFFLCLGSLTSVSLFVGAVLVLSGSAACASASVKLF